VLRLLEIAESTKPAAKAASPKSAPKKAAAPKRTRKKAGGSQGGAKD
jgi:hypothetical protein